MTSSPADSPANPYPSQGNDSPKTTRGGSGPSISESFAWYDPDSSSWKTSQGSLLPEWAMFSETWPRSGMTVSGKAFRLPLLAPLTYGGGSSSWPTPQARDYKGPSGRAHNGMVDDLPSAVGEQIPSIGGRLNPMWVEWLMGFPEGWTDLED